MTSTPTTPEAGQRINILIKPFVDTDRVDIEVGATFLELTPIGDWFVARKPGSRHLVQKHTVYDWEIAE